MALRVRSLCFSERCCLRLEKGVIHHRPVEDAMRLSAVCLVPGWGEAGAPESWPSRSQAELLSVPCSDPPWSFGLRLSFLPEAPSLPASPSSRPAPSCPCLSRKRPDCPPPLRVALCASCPCPGGRAPRTDRPWQEARPGHHC